MENAYIYTRVSTIIQVDGFSLDAQEKEIRAFAKLHDISIAGKYSDEGKSGKNAEHRPAFNQMMNDIKCKKDNVKFVLVFKLSRFARNTSDTAKYLQELASYGVGLLGVKDGIDTSTVTGKMIANIWERLQRLNWKTSMNRHFPVDSKKQEVVSGTEPRHLLGMPLKTKL